MPKPFARRAPRAALVAFLFLASVLALAWSPARGWAGPPPRYVFLFIGDGMGVAQRMGAARWQGGPLVMDGFPVHGLTTTAAVDSPVTDSAAAVTALATGVKTILGRLGLGPDLRPLPTVAELAHARGMRVGIVTSVSVDHATPAGFYAHVPARGMYHEIDHALAASGFEYFAGGGLRDPRGEESRAPRGDALERIRAAGYAVAVGRAELDALRPGGRTLAMGARLHDGQSLPYVLDADAGDVTLAEFTARGIALLDNPQGFFMMVEGGKIDWACHANDAAATLTETLAFDDAVAVAVRFAAGHPGQTLVLVTADHECGGLALAPPDARTGAALAVLRRQGMSLQRFVAALPRGPEGGRFEELEIRLGALFGSGGGAAPQAMALDGDEEQALRVAWARPRPGADSGRGGNDPLAVILGQVLGHKAGLDWGRQGHSGVPVSTSALGVGQERFAGTYDNAELGRRLLRLMGLAPAPGAP
jgi:alkaline phosphatase